MAVGVNRIVPARPALAGMRLPAARTLAWLLLLTGWIGLGSLLQAQAPGVLAGFALIALWLLATGAFAAALARARLTTGAMRLALVGAALATAVALLAAPSGGGAARGLVLPLAWAATIALASVAVRACRAAAARRPASPVASGAGAALLTWLVVGDLGDLNALRLRLACAVLAAGLGLALLWPRRGGAAEAGCRAALFDCALPAWPATGWRDPGHWPLMLAALVMLPMMGGLPLMLGLCRSETLGAQAALGLHLAAMFGPAWALRRARWAPGFAPACCAGLLVVGAIALAGLGGAAGWWSLVLAHGTAWSVAWAARLNGVATHGPLHSPLAGAALNALLMLALGVALDRVGLSALADWHGALGVAAAGAVVASGLRLSSAARPRCRPPGRPR